MSYRMMKGAAEVDELNHDRLQTHPVASIFDGADEAEELSQETNNPLDGHYERIDGKDVFVPRKNKMVGDADGFRVPVEISE